MSPRSDPARLREWRIENDPTFHSRPSGKTRVHSSPARSPAPLSDATDRRSFVESGGGIGARGSPHSLEYFRLPTRETPAGLEGMRMRRRASLRAFPGSQSERSRGRKPRRSDVISRLPKRSDEGEAEGTERLPTLGIYPSFSSKCGFSITPKTFSNGSKTVATRMPSPTSRTASPSDAPSSRSRPTAASASSTPQ